MVTDEEIKFGTLYPPLANIRKVSAAIAAAVAAELYDLGLAKVQPRPDDLEAYCVAQMWDCTYGPILSLPTIPRPRNYHEHTHKHKHTHTRARR